MSGFDIPGFDIRDRQFAHYILANAALEELATGFRWVAGPVWFGDANCLLFQDLPRNRTMRWSEAEGASVFRFPSDYVFHKIEPGYCDGLKVDEDGNLWSSAGDGVHCIDPHGKLLGKVLVPHIVANVAFGGLWKNRLFIAAAHTLYALFLNRRGAGWP